MVLTDDYFTYNDFNTLQELLCGKELKVIDLKYIRMVKDKRELELMWRAVKIADEAYLRLLDELQPGMTEKNSGWPPGILYAQPGSRKTRF